MRSGGWLRRRAKIEDRQIGEWAGRSVWTILKVTGGVTSRVFIMIKSLAIEVIETGEERITDDAVQSWQPVWAKRAWSIPRQPIAKFG